MIFDPIINLISDHFKASLVSFHRPRENLNATYVSDKLKIKYQIKIKKIFTMGVLTLKYRNHDGIFIPYDKDVRYRNDFY